MAIAGKVSKLQVSTDGGTTYSDVLGRVDMTLNLNKSEIDASHMDSAGWAEYLHGRKDATIDFTVRYIEDDPGQVILVENYFADPTEDFDLKFLLQEGDGLYEFTGQGFVTSLSPSPSDESPTDMSGTIRINGPVTKGTQVVV